MDFIRSLSSIHLRSHSRLTLVLVSSCSWLSSALHPLWTFAQKLPLRLHRTKPSSLQALAMESTFGHYDRLGVEVLGFT